MRITNCTPDTSKISVCTLVRVLFILSVALLLVACQDESDSGATDDEMAGEPTPGTEMTEDGDEGEDMSDDATEGDEDSDEDMSDDMTGDEETEDDMSDGDMMADEHMDDDMMGMGGNGESRVLAEERVTATPDEPLGWVAYELTSSGDETASVRPDSPGFVYAAEGTHTLTVEGSEFSLAPNEAVFTSGDVEYVHEGEGRIWDIRLTQPDADAPDGMQGGEAVFASGELEGVPDEPVHVYFVRVDLPPGAETSVHTHPGPEYIYVTEGEIIYENELVDPEPMQAGDDHSMPAQTAVQKRNPEGDAAAFLSWFVLDPDMPFAAEASFD